MVVFPNGKINLGLHVTRKRADGYHDLETVFYPILVKDVLEIIQGDVVKFTLSGLPVAGTVNDNLCLKAYYLLKIDFPELPPVNIHLHKVIPMGAGLGGGSADGGFTLALLSQKFKLNLSKEQLFNYALQLGSDCPFFILNKPCYAEGRGEILELLDVDLSAYKFVLVHPGIHVSTALAFSKLKPAESSSSIQQIITQPIETWKEQLINDFEEPVFDMFPEIKEIKVGLYRAGALYASMSGSGSCVYGIFKDEEITLPTFPLHYSIHA